MGAKFVYLSHVNLEHSPTFHINFGIFANRAGRAPQVAAVPELSSGRGCEMANGGLGEMENFADMRQPAIAGVGRVPGHDLGAGTLRYN